MEVTVTCGPIQFHKSIAGYWTDNGAYYYYKTLDGLNYEDTLIQLRQSLDEQDIPVQYLEVGISVVTVEELFSGAGGIQQIFTSK